jgi:hypothetical protein
MIKVIVAGGRDFNDYPLLSTTLKNLFRNRKPEEIEIVCGMAPGADILGKRYGDENNIHVQKFPAEWDSLDTTPCVIKYRNGKPYNALAGFARNKQMAEYATHLVLFWNGKSPGSKDMLTIAEQSGLITRIIYY